MSVSAPVSAPPRVKPRLKSAPKIRQVYWCDFWRDAHLPEMWKVRPVVVVSYRNTLYGPCLVVPFSTDPANATNAWACPITLPDGKSWAICNQPSTVAVSRLSQYHGKILKLPEEVFNPILGKLLDWLPKIISP
jgi:mRNA interferase MazF